MPIFSPNKLESTDGKARMQAGSVLGWRFSWLVLEILGIVLFRQALLIYRILENYLCRKIQFTGTTSKPLELTLEEIGHLSLLELDPMKT